MAQNDLVLSVEEQLEEEVHAQVEGPADGSERIETLAGLKFELDRLRRLGKAETSRSPTVKPKCPQVPKGLLRSDAKGSELADDEPHVPKVMSLGPYHHGKDHLVRGEKLKLKLAAAYIQQIGKLVEQPQIVDDIYKMIGRKIKDLRGFYDEGSTEKFSDEKFSVMMMVDGCALLWYILCVCLGGDHEDYNIRYQDLSLIHQDALLLENQLPYQFLLYELMKKILEPDSAWTVMFQEFFGTNDESFFPMNQGEELLERKVKNHPCFGLHLADKESMQCQHLLDLFRRYLLGDERSSNQGTEISIRTASVGDVKEQVMASFRNVKELMAAGIRIKRSPTRQLRDISFHSNGITACLRIPPITIDNSTKVMFLNLIAYEMTSDVDHDFISYLRFLDSLIDHADDVKELQSIGVLQNNLGTHEEVAQFFNTVSANLESNFRAYKDVRVKIRKHLKSHYNSRLKMWMTQCLDTYFGSPWTIIAWVGAALALFFTAVQTYFSAFHH